MKAWVAIMGIRMVMKTWTATSLPPVAPRRDDDGVRPSLRTKQSVHQSGADGKQCRVAALWDECMTSVRESSVNLF